MLGKSRGDPRDIPGKQGRDNPRLSSRGTPSSSIPGAIRSPTTSPGAVAPQHDLGVVPELIQGGSSSLPELVGLTSTSLSASDRSTAMPRKTFAGGRPPDAAKFYSV